jgi:hypothetical protein
MANGTDVAVDAVPSGGIPDLKRLVNRMLEACSQAAGTPSGLAGGGTGKATDRDAFTSSSCSSRTWMTSPRTWLGNPEAVARRPP